MNAELAALKARRDKSRDLKPAAMQQLPTGPTRLPGSHGEWEVKTLGKLFDLSAGKSKTAFVSDEGDYWVCDMGSVSTEGKLVVSKRTNYRAEFLEEGDLVMPKDDIGGGKIIGKVGYVDANGLYVLGDHVYRLCAREGDSRFLAYMINSHRTNSELRRKVIGSAQLGLGRSSVEEQEVIVPQLAEQIAIATALSDVDALLDGLERLVAKKRDLKEAAMQQLLTGQTRLPGLHGEWEVKTLGKLFDLSAGKSKTAFVTDEGDYWVCDMGSVSTEGKLVVSKRTNYRAEFLEEGDLVMPKDDIGGGKIIGKVGYVDANGLYVLGDHVYRLRAREGDSRFLAYMINSHRTNSELRRKVIGSAQLGLGRSSVEEQEVTVPQLAEQTAIADLLSDMDAELAALKARRDKTRDLKQAIMQELLTGKTRLVPAGGAHG